mgnify:CR=1 FL=1
MRTTTLLFLFCIGCASTSGNKGVCSENVIPVHYKRIAKKSARAIKPKVEIVKNIQEIQDKDQETKYESVSICVVVDMIGDESKEPEENCYEVMREIQE